MATYTKLTNFTVKDGLAPGNPSKIIYGADFDTEFSAVSTAISVNNTRFDLEHEADDGKHKYVTLPPQASTPSASATHGVLYSKDVAGVTELFYKDDNGVEVQMTVNGTPSATLASATAANFTVEEVLTVPVVKVSSDPVTVSEGNFTFNLDAASVFYITMSANATVTFVAADDTKVYSFMVIVTNTGANLFTALTMSDVVIYQPKDLGRLMQPSGRTCFGCVYNGPGATLDIFPVEMELA
jgi:hypothetical protein